MAERIDGLPVGKGNPPEKSRYKKGKSGNPAGRPKGRKNLKTIVRSVAHEMQSVNINGELRELTTAELLIAMLQRRALSGEYGATRLMDEVRQKYGVAEDDASGISTIVIPPTMELDEFLVMASAQRKRML